MHAYPQPDGSHFIWDSRSVLIPLSEVRSLQGRLQGRMEDIDASLRDDAILETLSAEVITSNELDGAGLDREQVRSSIARLLGIKIEGLKPSALNAAGAAEMTLDAILAFDESLTGERLNRWYEALFPFGVNSAGQIAVHKHEALNQFLRWFNHIPEPDSPAAVEPVIKSGIAHLWFETIRPYDNGNGRIARAIAEMQLARAEKSSMRFYSVSTQLALRKDEYAEELSLNRKGGSDITGWLIWYLDILVAALQAAESLLSIVFSKARFWKTHASTIMNERQQQMINELLEDFSGRLTTSRWAEITGTSQDTALRDIQDLLQKKILQKEPGGGRSTSYALSLSSQGHSITPN